VSPSYSTRVKYEPGFRSVKIRDETADLVYARAEDWWAFLLTPLLPRVAIMSMDEKTHARFKDEYFAKLSPMFQPHGLHISLAIIYALAILKTIDILPISF
jgi:hypothetical protein